MAEAKAEVKRIRMFASVIHKYQRFFYFILCVILRDLNLLKSLYIHKFKPFFNDKISITTLSISLSIFNL